jgi:hypothetical protein
MLRENDNVRRSDCRRIIGRPWFLGASTELPDVVPADVEIDDPDELTG